jgi:sugar phosphate isomerase/epimerase
MLREIADLGFAWAELSHGIRLSLVPGILRAVEEGMIRISSLHNFCPLPVGVMGAAPNLYEPSAASRRERILWLHNTRKTVDFAQRLECDRIILHSGRARFLFRDPGEAFEAIHGAGGEDTEVLEKARAQLLRKVKGRKKAAMKRLKESFELLAEHVKDTGVRFGVENREGLTELPLDEEMDAFLASLGEAGCYDYWHDAGHAELKARMGFIEHETFLGTLRPRLAGFHLHDVSAENRDHQVPGSGVIDWQMLARQVKPTDLVVMEMSPRLRSSEIKAGQSFLVDLLPFLGN